MNYLIYVPEKNHFVKNFLARDMRLADEEWAKALPFIKEASRIREGMVVKLIKYCYSLIPPYECYQPHRDFLNRPHLQRVALGRKGKTKRLLEIFIQAETRSRLPHYKGFHDQGEGEIHGLFTYIRTERGHDPEGAKERVVAACQMLKEINRLFKKVGKFTYFVDPNNAYVEISFRLKN